MVKRIHQANKTSMRVFFLVFFTLAFYFGNSQNPNIPNDNSSIHSEIEGLEKAKRNNAEEMEKFELFTKSFIQTKNTAGKTMAFPDTSCVATIPVVFHVFHPNGSAGVLLSQINYAINDLNRTFAGTDADYTTVDANFASVKSYTKIRFALAKIDPNGNATNGVVYYKDKQIGYANGPMWDNEIAAIAWDNYKYFNVYVMNDLFGNNVTNNSGFCFYPSSSQSSTKLARMVYNYSYLGQGGSSFNNLEFNQTFTHECGHYMNLFHTFEGNNCSGTGDFCADTPPTNIAGGGCNATVCSALINGENYMDYNATCYKNFTMDQNARMEAALVHPARITLWQYDNLVATGVINPASTNTCVNAAPFFSYSKTQLYESISNNGSVDMPPIIIYAMGTVQFASANQTLIQGTDYTISNLPAGLTASVNTSASGKTATLTLIGQAGNHSSASSLTNINFAFTNAAVVGGSVSAVTNYTATLKIKFYDAWGFTCASSINLSATSSNTWTSFQTNGPVPKNYGLKYSSGNLYLESYGRGLITMAANNDNIIFLPIGTLIGPASTWREGGNAGVLYNPGYTTLDGNTGFVGFRMPIGNDYYYGYMTVQVSSTSGVTLLEYVYNNKPNDPITAGVNCVNVGLKNSFVANPPLIYPNPVSETLMVANIKQELVGGICSVYSADGRLVMQLDLDATNLEINCGQLTAGFYILEFSSTQNSAMTTRMKIIKN
jgi:hypothetical protein